MSSYPTHFPAFGPALIEYRAFRNSDVPAVAEIWRASPAFRGMAQPMSVSMLETYVFSKPYFDHQGLLLAVEDGRPIGFVHSGFGPSDDLQSVDQSAGVISMLLVQDRERAELIATELIDRAEQHLIESGVKKIHAFGVGKMNPFYMGLYGGSASPGLLQSGPVWHELLRARGYEPQWHVSVLQRELAGFRPPVDRVQMQIRRTSVVNPVPDPKPKNWWAACTKGCFDQIRFELAARGGGESIAQATFWNMEPLAASWGVHAMGLVDLETSEEIRRHGMATYLVGEAMRQLHAEGFTLIEVQLREEAFAALGVFHKLGFQPIDRGHVLVKHVN